MTTLVWLQRELRLNHLPALTTALDKDSSVILAYFHDPKQTIGDANSVWLAASLQQLQQDLMTQGGQLWILEGDFENQLEKLINNHQITAIHYSFQVGQPFTTCQQQALKLCQQYQVSLRPFFSEYWLKPEDMLNRQQKPYLVFTPFYKAMQSKLDMLEPLPVQSMDKRLFSKLLSNPDVQSLPFSLEKLLKTDWAQKLLKHWKIGERAAWKKLDDFIENHLQSYRQDRDFPALEATSQLSPHLHFGEISSRQLYFYLQTKLEVQHSSWQELNPWIRQLCWREFARCLLWFFPETETQPFQTKFNDAFWEHNPPLLYAWQKGQTGIPIIDAGMRELWETGSMHNRVRMLVASLLTKNLNLSWLEGKQWFDHTLVDADPANNAMGWQWVAGCGVDAAPYYRLFNPIKQSETFDPQGEYLRRWLPELSRLSNTAIHAPWEYPIECKSKGIRLGVDYPMPIVDLKQSRLDHLEKMQALKQASNTV